VRVRPSLCGGRFNPTGLDLSLAAPHLGRPGSVASSASAPTIGKHGLLDNGCHTVEGFADSTASLFQSTLICLTANTLAKVHSMVDRQNCSFLRDGLVKRVRLAHHGTMGVSL